LTTGCILKILLYKQIKDIKSLLFRGDRNGKEEK